MRCIFVQAITLKQKTNTMTTTYIETADLFIITTEENKRPVSKENIVSVEPKYSLNHNGTREDRKRAFEANDYKLVGYNWTVKL